MSDRTDILSGIVEHALSAVPGITGVIRGYDWFPPGQTAQPLAPYIVVTVSDDEEIGIGFGLWTATVQIDLAVNWCDTIRATLGAVRESARGVMQGLVNYSFDGLTVDGLQEQSCTPPDVASPTGDVTLAQILSFRVWFACASVVGATVTGMTALPPPPFVVDDDVVDDDVFDGTGEGL